MSIKEPPCTCSKTPYTAADLDPNCPQHGSRTSTPERIAEVQARQRLAELRSEHSGTEQAPERAIHPHRRNIGKLERPGPRTKLIAELARAEKTQRQLAANFGCAPSSIAEFVDRHREEIEAKRQENAQAYDHVWIGDKQARLAELEQLFDDLGDGGIEPDVARTAKDLLRAAAEELGQIPNKTTVVAAQPFELILREDGQAKPDMTEEADGASAQDEYDGGL